MLNGNYLRLRPKRLRMLTVASLLLLLCFIVEDCLASSRCPAPPSTLQNGAVSPTWNGYMVRFHCDRGFQLRGAATAICKNGRWNHPPPTCHQGGSGSVAEPTRRYGVLRSLTDTQYQEKYDLPGHRIQTDRPNRLKSDRPLFSWDPQIRKTSPGNPTLENDGAENKATQTTTTHNQISRAVNVTQFARNRARRKKPSTAVPQHHFKEEDGGVEASKTKGMKNGDESNFMAMKYSSIELGQLDMSCKLNDNDSWFLPAPHIRHGVIDAYRRRHNPEEPFNNYLEAFYVCRRGYVFQNSIAHSVYCLRGKWVGQLPHCISKESPIHNQTPSDDNAQSESSFDVNDDDPEMGPKRTCKVNKAGCQQVCEEQKDSESDAKCLCYLGYRLKDDQKTCSDVNECEADNGGCQHQCWNIPGSYVCVCDDGYALASDRKSCNDKNECLLNNGHGPCQDGCRNKEKGYECYCSLSGTQLALDNHTCEDIDECAADNFGCAHSCLNTIGSAFCACDEGYMLAEDWKSCEDVDECEFPEIRETCTGRCVNTVGSYRCETGQTTSSDPLPTHPKSHPDQCQPGYQWSRAENTCVDVDECQEDNNGCSHACTNLPGSVSCSCPSGFSLLEDWKTCEEVDQCLNGDLKCQYRCVNTNGSAHCTCPANYQPLPDGNCQDVNECFKDNGGCSQLCVNTEGGHRCQCESPHVLAADGKSCRVSLCLAMDEPNRGRIVCDRELEERRFYPVNTNCQVVCQSDTEIIGPERIRCLENGEWSHPQFKCNEPSLCSKLNSPDNGYVTPSSCVSHWKEEGELCYFHCNDGYVLKGVSKRICGPTQQWDPHETPECVQMIEETVELECPRSVTTDLPQNTKRAFLKLPQPSSNVDAHLLKVYPSWVHNYQGEFPSGVTLVTVRVVHPVTGMSKSCSFHVNVRDRFPPMVYNCPQPISHIVLDDDSDAAIVNWEEPYFVDNVGVVSVWKSREQGTRLPPGLHHVRYVARDAAGNTGNCGFSFQIIKVPKISREQQAVPIGYNQQPAPHNLLYSHC